MTDHVRQAILQGAKAKTGVIPSRDPQCDIDFGSFAFLEFANGLAPKHDSDAIAEPDRFLYFL